MLDYIIVGLAIILVILGGVLGLSNLIEPRECVELVKIKSLDRATDYTHYLLDDPEPSEWLYTLENGKKMRFQEVYYPGEEVCIDWK